MSNDVTDERAVITIEVELASDVTGNPVRGEPPEPFFEGLPDDMQEVISEIVNDILKDEIEDALDAEGVDVDSLKEVVGLVKDVDAKGIGNLKAVARNPEGFMENTFMAALGRAGPYGALVAAIISAIAGSPEMVKAVVSALGVKGAPLNQDYRFSEDEQINQQFDRHTQYRRLTGDDPVITLQSRGFVVGDPDFVQNSLVDVDTGRTGRIDLRQTSLGYIHGI